MAVASVTYTIRDAKGEESTVTLYTTDGQDLTALFNAVVTMGGVVAKLLRGVITGASLCFNVDITSLVDNTLAADDVDVEEGAIFIFNTDSGFNKRNRLPTFDEQYILAGSRDVDTRTLAGGGIDDNVADFIQAMGNGVLVQNASAANVQVDFTDQRGDPLAAGVKEAYESFQSSRSRR